ncbi:MAG TPA: PLP-dependent transferase [Candidatus Sulfotelmatobacter sp.]|nr:PLP-dependent transferase [Candidatus Sulfotelmatobacter sp.]
MTTPRPDAPLDPSVQADFPGTGGGLERYARDPAWHFDTLAVHGGFEPDAETGAVAPPIYQTSTYAQEGVERPRHGWEYARTGNPTRSRLEAAVAALEGARHGLAFASGSATTAAIAALAVSGDEVVVSDDVYGGTYRLFERVLHDMGVTAHYVDLSEDPGAVLAKAVTRRTRLVWVETPSNPLLKLVDLTAVAQALERRKGPGGERPVLVVDNTFASPAGQQPLQLGADIAFHSATKYLAGHSDTVNGVLATSRDDLYERLAFLQNAIGAVPGPFDCFLVLRGLRTLPLRVERHAANATAVAAALASRTDVARLRYPGLADGPHAHPQAALARRQMRYPGGMVSFVPAARDGRTPHERARRFVEATRIFTLAESLGGVESLCELPAVMTHGSVQGSALEVPAALIRLSVGIEHPDDLVADVMEALDQA